MGLGAFADGWQTSGFNAKKKTIGCHCCRSKQRKSSVPHLRWSQAPPLPWQRPGSADICLYLYTYIDSYSTINHLNFIFITSSTTPCFSVFLLCWVQELQLHQAGDHRFHALCQRHLRQRHRGHLPGRQRRAAELPRGGPLRAAGRHFLGTGMCLCQLPRGLRILGLR